MFVHIVAFSIVSGRSFFWISVMVDFARRDVPWLHVLNCGKKTIRRNRASVSRFADATSKRPLVG